MIKTNAMRMLDKAKIPYDAIEYEVDESDLSGTSIAAKSGIDPECCFKTLVARGDKTGPVVMCIPVENEIDLKKAARVSGNKKVEMLHVKELLGLTGYIRGGCSPIGMKKKFPTFFNDSALLHDKISVSAGVRGCQLYLDCKSLVKFTDSVVCDLIKDKD